MYLLWIRSLITDIANTGSFKMAASWCLTTIDVFRVLPLLPMFWIQRLLRGVLICWPSSCLRIQFIRSIWPKIDPARRTNWIVSQESFKSLNHSNFVTKFLLVTLSSQVTKFLLHKFLYCQVFVFDIYIHSLVQGMQCLCVFSNFFGVSTNFFLDTDNFLTYVTCL